MEGTGNIISFSHVKCLHRHLSSLQPHRKLLSPSALLSQQVLLNFLLELFSLYVSCNEKLNFLTIFLHLRILEQRLHDLLVFDSISSFILLLMVWFTFSVPASFHFSWHISNNSDTLKLSILMSLLFLSLIEGAVSSCRTLASFKE